MTTDGAAAETTEGRAGASAAESSDSSPSPAALADVGPSEDGRGGVATTSGGGDRLAAGRDEPDRLERVLGPGGAGFRRTAIGLAVLGGCSLLAAALVPGARTVLVALGGVGLVGAVLAAALVPERFLTASVADRIASTAARNAGALVAEPDLQTDRVYVPAADGVRLFVPQHETYEVPTNPDELFLDPIDGRARGIALVPVGNALLADLRAALPGDLATAPGPALEQAADGLARQFELVGAAHVETATDAQRATVAITAPAVGDPTAIDHPAPSLLATTLVAALEEPVWVDVAPGDRSDAVVTLTWGAAGRPAGAPAATNAVGHEAT